MFPEINWANEILGQASKSSLMVVVTVNGKFDHSVKLVVTRSKSIFIVPGPTREDLSTFIFETAKVGVFAWETLLLNELIRVATTRKVRLFLSGIILLLLYVFIKIDLLIMGLK